MSRFYEAMRRALEQQGEPPEAETALNPRQQREEHRDFELPFDSDATTPVRLDLAEQLRERRDGVPAGASPNVDDLPEPVPIRLADPTPRRTSPPPLHPAYERLVQSVLAFRGGRRHCTLLVVSAVPGEGASTVARNLAVSLGKSQPSGNVVLVDANLRTPSQHHELAAGTDDGLAEVLAGRVPLTKALRSLEEVGISVLPSGRPENSPPHLLTVSALQGVATGLESRYDWVILDGPPVTAYPDASNLAAVADGVILVLRAEKTRWEVAERAVSVLRDAGATVLGGVLNKRRYHIPNFIYKRL